FNFRISITPYSNILQNDEVPAFRRLLFLQNPKICTVSFSMDYWKKCRRLQINHRLWEINVVLQFPSIDQILLVQVGDDLL
ncbi:hypothetical protein PFISCL1PPCAC_5909, partial [Pristionchus fissidentatus]